MLPDAFDKALSSTLGFEGGTSDHVADRGGLTQCGVTQGAYDAWRRRNGEPAQPVTAITEDEMRMLYHDDYWIPAGCDQIPDPLAILVFDMAVNSGPAAAIRALQRALGVSVDGQMGPQTIAAAAAAGAAAGLAFLKARAALYRDIVQRDPTQIVFLAGWINRLLDQAWRLP